MYVLDQSQKIWVLILVFYLPVVQPWASLFLQVLLSSFVKKERNENDGCINFL